VIALAGVAASWTLVTRMTSTELVWLGGVSVLALLH
jgi:hypothetical protein